MRWLSDQLAYAIFDIGQVMGDVGRTLLLLVLGALAAFLFWATLFMIISTMITMLS